MSRFLQKAGTVTLALVLALGWKWTDELKQYNYISDTQRNQIIVGITILLALQQTYLVLPKPVKKGVIEKHKTIVENQLTDFLEKYYEILDKSLRGRDSPIVRVNVMLPTKKWRGVLGTYLKIYYYRCPDKVTYTGEEFMLQWKKGEGTCGSAWKINMSTIFDSVTPNLKLPAKSIRKAKSDVVGSIKCSLSIPMLLDDSVVGVLNLDSKQNIDDTLFLDNDILVLAGACAKTLSGQFFEDGVEG